MYCEVRDCVSNMDGTCSNDLYVSIDADGTCDSINIKSKDSDESTEKEDR